MKTYYYIDGSQRGPVTEAELHELFAEGKITAHTHILENGTDLWRKYQDTFKQAEPAPAARAKVEQVYKNIANESTKYVETIRHFDYNRMIEPLFDKFFILPSFLASQQKRSSYFIFAANGGSILCWVSYFLYTLNSLSGAAGFFDFVVAAIIGVIGGFLLQKIFYHCYKMTSEALQARRVILGSLDFPKIAMLLSFLFVLFFVIITSLSLGDKSEDIAEVISKLLEIEVYTPSLFLFACTLFFILLTLYFSNAAKVNVDVVKKTLTPGLHFVNILRYLISTITLTLHTLTPIIIIIYIISLSVPKMSPEERIFSMDSYSPRYIASYSDKYINIDKDANFEISDGIIFLLPLANLVLLFGASVPLDILSSLMTDRAARRRKDETSEDNA